MISLKYHIHLTGDFDFSIGFHRSPAVISTADQRVNVIAVRVQQSLKIQSVGMIQRINPFNGILNRFFS